MRYDEQGNNAAVDLLKGQIAVPNVEWVSTNPSDSMYSLTGLYRPRGWSPETALKPLTKNVQAEMKNLNLPFFPLQLILMHIVYWLNLRRLMYLITISKPFL